MLILHKTVNLVRDYSLHLIGGALLALYLGNVFPGDYARIHDLVLVEDFYFGHPHTVNEETHYTLTLHYFVNDLLMALFFAMAGKEVWEAFVLKEGSLRGSKALTPLVATAGGVIGPIAIYLVTAYLFGSTTFDAIKNGWAIPTATDIAFSYMVGRMIFGAGHPAVKFLLTIAVVDDAVGVMILAAFFPTNELALSWLWVSIGSAVIAYTFFNYLPRRLVEMVSGRHYVSIVRKLDWVPFVIAGAVSWYAFAKSGIHPALGLLPIIPAIPHGETDLGLFDGNEDVETDMLNRLEHSLRIPVDISLLLFGFMNAGVQFSAVGAATWAVLAGLFIGKPLGIFIFGCLAVYVFRLRLPVGVRISELLPIGMVAGIGFTVSLFVTGVALPVGPYQDAAKMGALLSLFAFIPAYVLAYIVRVVKVK